MDEFSDPNRSRRLNNIERHCWPCATNSAQTVRLASPKNCDSCKSITTRRSTPITSGQLAERVGFPSYSAANLRYGLLASRIAAELGYRPGPFTTVPPGDPHWWRTLAYGNDGVALTKDGEYEWVMRPELCQALAGMGWVGRRRA